MVTRQWLVDDRGFLWLGTTDVYHIVKMALDSVELMTVERQVARQRVSAPEKQRQIERIKSYWPAASVDPDAITDWKPTWAGMLVDDAGYLWVGRTPSEDANPGGPFRIDVFDPEGRLQAELPSPLGIGLWLVPLVIRGDRMVGVVRDEDDVERVRIVQIRRGARAR